MVSICEHLIDMGHVSAAKQCLEAVELCGFISKECLDQMRAKVQAESPQNPSNEPFYFAN